MKKHSLNQIKEETEYELSLLEEEYIEIVNKTAKNKDSFPFLSEQRLKEIYIKRKDRKYAALVVELCALVEQFLKNIYSVYNTEVKYKNENGKSIIEDLQTKLKDYVNFSHCEEIKRLVGLRNYIVHKDFSMKSARKNHGINEKSRKVVAFLLNSVKSYIDGVSPK